MPTENNSALEERKETDTVECSCCNEECSDFGTDIEVDGDQYDFLCSECRDDVHNCEDCGHSMFRESDTLRLTENGDTYCDDCYDEIFAQCDRCEIEHNRDDIRYSETDDANYCENCYEDEESAVDLDSYSNRNMGEDSRSNRIVKSMRLIGLEVETITTEWDYWDIEGDSHPTTFRPVHDSSIERGENGSGVEWVMRTPSNGDDLYNKISNLTQYLQGSQPTPSIHGEYEFDVNRSCGLHVHVDARDCEWKQLKYILLLGKAVQDVIYKMLPPSRDNGRWCRRIPMTRSDILAIESNDEFIDAWYNSWDVNPSMEKYNDSRYCGMNMHSRIINGSVEFRYHSGTINQEKILNWVKICTAIVDVGIEISKQRTRTVEIENAIRSRDLTYEEFFKYLGLDEDVREYVDKRMAKFYNKNKEEDYRVLEYSI